MALKADRNELDVDISFFYDEGVATRGGIVILDTVGSGDSFLATLLEGMLTNRNLKHTLKRACAMGALVAGSAGANANISEATLREYIEQFA